MSHELVLTDAEGNDGLYCNPQALQDIFPSGRHTTLASSSSEGVLREHLEQYATNPYGEHPSFNTFNEERVALLAISARALREARGGYGALWGNTVRAWIFDGEKWHEPAPLTKRPINLDGTLYATGIAADNPLGRAVLGFERDAVPTLLDTVAYEISDWRTLALLDVPSVALPIQRRGH